MIIQIIAFETLFIEQTSGCVIEPNSASRTTASDSWTPNNIWLDAFSQKSWKELSNNETPISGQVR